MNDDSGKPLDFSAAKARLEEIANEVSSEDISLDDALDLFEEAVSLGLQVGNVLEDDIEVDGEPGAEQAGNADPVEQSSAQDAAS